MASKRQRVLERVRFIKKNYVLGAGRTAQLTALKRKYHVSEPTLRKWCFGISGATYRV